MNSTGNLDFGLMRYQVGVGGTGGSCSDATNCCSFANGACQCQPDYTDNSNASSPGGQTCSNANWGRISWFGGCGPKANNQALNGGQILVTPGANSSSSVLTWVDGVEDFRAGTGGFPINGELRGNGPTPVAGSIRSALSQWYTPIRAASTPGCNPNTNPNCDPQIDCRPYVFVLLTDGADSCEGCNSTGGCPQLQTCTADGQCTGGRIGSCVSGQCTCTNDAQCPATHRCNTSISRCYDARQLDNPPVAAQQLYDANPTNPVRTYVIGVAFVPGDPAIDSLNQTAGTAARASPASPTTRPSCKPPSPTSWPPR